MDPINNRDRRNAVYGDRPRPLAPRGVSRDWEANQVQAPRHLYPQGRGFDPLDPNLSSVRPAPLRIKKKSVKVTTAQRVRSQTVQDPTPDRVQSRYPYPGPSGPVDTGPFPAAELSRLRRPPPPQFAPVESAPRLPVARQRRTDPLDYISQPNCTREASGPSFSHQGTHGFRRPSSSRYPVLTKSPSEKHFPQQTSAERKVSGTLTRPDLSQAHQRSTTNPQKPSHSPLHQVQKTKSTPQPHQFLTPKKGNAFNPICYIPGCLDSTGQLHFPESKKASHTNNNSPLTPPYHQCDSQKPTATPKPEHLRTPNPNAEPGPQHSTLHFFVARASTGPANNKETRLRKLGHTLKAFCIDKISKKKPPELSKVENIIPLEYYPRAVAELHKPQIRVEVDQVSDTDSEKHLEYSTMASLGHLDPSSAVAALSKQKSEAMRLAREQASAVKEMCRRAKSELPPYAFDELIGKGTYGRVYKGRHLPSRAVVAIKVMDIDKLDYNTTRDFRDESIKDFIQETKVMKQVKDSGAKNINMLIESVSIHSQLWLVCEYCPGGSVKTLMRAMDDKLSEKFIIPVARELAEGLNAIHKAGIIHRDIKAANVLIHEEGRLEICDFGVAGVLQSQLDKRSTWIGTPHWMPPELFPSRPTEHQYGSEVDVWAYGCTIFECATGNPPNATLRERMQIGRQINRIAPRLESEEYSEGVRSLISYALESDPRTRPSMEDILQHPYIAESTESHPTDSLRELVRIYYQWTQRGGQRISLFNPGGAAAAEMPEHRESLDGETWNFSTTDGFEKRFSLLDLNQISESMAALEGERTPTSTSQSLDIPEEDEATELTPEQRANFDERVKRGAEAMEGLFDEGKPDYKYETKNDFVPVEQKQRNSSDLPLRTDTDRSSVTSTFIDIDLGVYDSARYASAAGTTHPPFQLADADTIRANRSSSRLFRNSSSAGSESQDEYPQNRGPRPPTMDWTFPSMATEEDEPLHSSEDEEEIAPDDIQLREEKRDTRAWTFPVMTAEDDPAEEPDEPEQEPLTAWGPNSEDDGEGLSRPFPLQRPPVGRGRNGSDLGLDVESTVRPTTSASSVSDADTDPFRFDREINQGAVLDGAPSLRDLSAEEEEDHGSSFDATVLRNGNFTGYPGVQSESSSIYASDERGRAFPAGTEGRSPLQFPSLGPPTMESLSEGASEDVVASELDRMFGGFLEGLLATHEAITSTDSGRAAGCDQQEHV